MQKIKNRILKSWLITLSLYTLVGVEILAMDLPMDQEPTNNHSSYKRPHEGEGGNGGGKKQRVKHNLLLEVSVVNRNLINPITAPLSIELEPQKADMMVLEEVSSTLESIISENDSDSHFVPAVNEPFSIESLTPHHSDIIFSYVIKHANHPTFFKLLYTSPWMHQSIRRVISSEATQKDRFWCDFKEALSLNFQCRTLGNQMKYFEEDVKNTGITYLNRESRNFVEIVLEVPSEHLRNHTELKSYFISPVRNVMYECLKKSLSSKKRALYVLTKNASMSSDKDPFFISLFFETLRTSPIELKNHRENEKKRIENLRILVSVSVIFLQDIDNFITLDFCKWAAAYCRNICGKATDAYNIWKLTHPSVYELAEKSEKLIKLKTYKYNEYFGKHESPYLDFRAIDTLIKYYNCYEVLFHFYKSTNKILPEEILFEISSKWQEILKKDYFSFVR